MTGLQLLSLNIFNVTTFYFHIEVVQLPLFMFFYIRSDKGKSKGKPETKCVYVIQLCKFTGTSNWNSRGRVNIDKATKRKMANQKSNKQTFCVEMQDK